MKDMFVFWLFASLVASHAFNVVAALEHLVKKGQTVTARECLRWDSPVQSRMPIRWVYFPLKWGALTIFAVVILLLLLDLNYYASLRPDTATAYWQTFLGIGRDLLGLAAVALVLLFYKGALTETRSALA